MRKVKFFKTAFLMLFVFCFLVPHSTLAQPDLQIGGDTELAAQYLEQMLPEERIGQLFLVTFNGPEAAPGTPNGNQIYDLIINYHIGGVVLKRDNDNFLGSDQTIPVLMSLIDQLQRNEFGSSLRTQINPRTSVPYQPKFVPLFIGINQNGDGFPYDQILTEMTELPNNMAIGASWQPDLARQTGEILGRELSLLGFNLIFGPSLDVLEPKTSGTGSSIGVISFGSDPYWVGEMGKAYVTGLHVGSENKLTVIGKHFPGLGGSDRLPEEEVATIRKNLEQLKQFELYPFFVTTGDATSQESTLDGMLTAHIRFQGFQENFRQTTKPISFDAQAFSNLMDLPAFSTWQENGGIMVSDSLGSRAVRRFYDPIGQTFNGRIAAVDAFLAGNDILFLDNFISSSDEESYTTITRTIEFFTQKYLEDPAFAQRVDESVLRILTLKLRLYDNNFLFNKTQPRFGSRNLLGQGRDVAFNVAREAATLINPPITGFDIPAPILREQIVFISDSRVFQQCSQCVLRNTVEVNSLQAAVERLYSPETGGLILPRDLTSSTFRDLYNMLEAGVGETELEAAIRQAEWLVFLTIEMDPNNPTSFSLTRFLDERPDLYQDKRIVVFSLNVPYNLDATDIAKLTAYYGLYSRSKEFIEIAARLLFQEIQPSGNLPVSVPGIGYDITKITFPNPTQIIPLKIKNPSETIEVEVETPEATLSILSYAIGELVDIIAGPIVDHNGHIVPDGTIVRFIITQSGEKGSVRQVDALTNLGMAEATIHIDTQGDIEIRAESEEAKVSERIQLLVPVDNITATASVTPSPTSTGTAEPTTTPTASITPIPTQTPVIAPVIQTNIGDWTISLIVTTVIALISYIYGRTTRQLRWAVRSGLLALIGGILAYTYLALDLPGSLQLLTRNGLWGIIITALLGASSGWLVSLVWKRLD